MSSVAQEFSDGQFTMAVEQKYLKGRLFCVGLRFDLFTASQVAVIILSVVPEPLAPALFNKKLF